MSSVPAAQPSTDNPNDAYEKLIRLSKRHAEALCELARLRAERDQLDKVLKQRQADYEKSMIKHAEFPSIPEVQNMHRTKYAERARLLDGRIQKAQDDVNKTAESIAHLIFGCFSVQEKDSENKPPATAGSLQHREASNLQAEISDLKAQIRQMQTRHSQEKDELKNEFARLYREMQGEMAAIVKEMKEGLEAKATRREGQEVKETLEAQLQAVRAEQDGLRSQLSKKHAESNQALEEKLLERINNSDRVPRAEISSLAQENSALRSDVSGLLRKVDELTEQLAQRNQETGDLRESLAASNRRIEDQAQKVDEHETKLSNIDLDALEGVAEVMSFGFPALQRNVENVQSKMDTLSGETEAKNKALLGQVQDFLARMGTTVGQMVDGLQGTVQDQGKRIEALEKAPSARTSTVTESPAMRVGLETLNSDVASIKADFDSAKVAVDQLTRKYTALSGQVNQLCENVATARKEIDGRLELAQHSFNVLDSRFNNLTTRMLAEHIIGQLEQVYSKPSQLLADVAGLKTQLNGLSSRLETLEVRVQDSQRQLVPAISEHLGKRLDDLTDHSKNGLPQKRKRTDTATNGAEHTATNGAG